MANPLDMFLGAIQGIVAILLVLRMNTLPDFVVYFFAVMLIVSGVLDIFST